MEHVLPIAWPPPYTVKKHRLARRVKLRASATGGLEITTPFRFSLKEIPSILEQHKDWILKQLCRLEPRQTHVLPNTIIFLRIRKSGRLIILLANPGWKSYSVHSGNGLVGKIDDKALCKRYLTHWIREQAKMHYIAVASSVNIFTTI